jgi:GntR family transcriptional regulator / MocR family aminotransferase
MATEPLLGFVMEPLLALPISLPVRGSRLLLRDLHRQLRNAITDGRLRPGARLPSTRALAVSCGVSRNTAVAAYELLLSEGYVVARSGSGTRVADSLPLPLAVTRQVGGGQDRRLTKDWRNKEARGSAHQRDAAPFSFQIGTPELRSFPAEVWRLLSNRVLRKARSQPALLADPQGQEPLRREIARYVAFSRAVSCEAEDIIVTAGAQQAFGLLARVLVTPGRTTVALEEPGYAPLRASFSAAGAKVSAVAVDAEGLIVDRLPPQARVICVTPSHQFPLGSVMSSRRRGELLDFAQARRAVVIEDDYDGEFRFGDRPLDALQTLDRAASVFYVGTFSKSLHPGLRLGYIVAPAWARPALVAAKALADGSCCTLTQDTLAAMIAEGHLGRHVRKMHRTYAGRREALLNGLRSECGAWLDPIPSAAGLHIAAVLRMPLNEATVMAEARKLGVQIHTLGAQYARRPLMRGLLLGYGAIEENAVAEGLTRLRRVLRLVNTTL